jgi:hypothetical protein
MTRGEFQTACAAMSVDDKPLVDAELAIVFGLSDSRAIRRHKSGESTVTGPMLEVLAYFTEHSLLPETAKAIRERRARDGRRKA